MATVIDLRLRRLERTRRLDRPAFLATDEELLAHLYGLLRQTIADPTSTPEAVERAQRLLHLPWGTRWSTWAPGDVDFLHEEAGLL